MGKVSKGIQAARQHFCLCKKAGNGEVAGDKKGDMPERRFAKKDRRGKKEDKVGNRRQG